MSTTSNTSSITSPPAHAVCNKENAGIALQVLKCTYSTCLLIFCIVIIMAAIFEKDTQVSQDVHSALAFIIIWIAVIWLSMVEGEQAGLVGLGPVDKDLYKESHPKTYKCTKIAHKGDNLDRYLIGRQFLVILIVFVINLSGRPLPGTNVMSMPPTLQKIFLDSGVAMILMTTNIGQLASQVNASQCMLDYINNYLALFTLYVALLIEFSGLLHSVYVVRMFFSYFSGKEFQSKETLPRSDFGNMFYYGRIYMSLAILGYSFAVTLKALMDGKTTMWDRVPTAVSIIFFFVLMGIVGMLEGMQIAFYAVAKLSREEQDKHPMAMKTCEVLFGKDRNLPSFMIGRQICVTMCFFFIARVTTINVDPDSNDSENIFGVSDGVQRFFDTGLLGALITTIVGSLSFQLIASTFPIAFLSNYVVFFLLHFCLFLEATGVCSASWVLAWIHKKVAGFEKDEVYIGSPEDRAANHHPDDDDALDVASGHFFPGVPTMPRSVTRYRRIKKQLSVKLGDELFPGAGDLPPEESCLSASVVPVVDLEVDTERTLETVNE